MVGTDIAHYKITGKLGQGGMGEVYRALDTKLDREVAIKVLPPEFAQHPERLARFEREAKALAKLNHQNIAAIYGFDQHEGQWFLALELVEGETLAEHLRKGPMAIDEALQVFQQIATALEAAHEKGIVHRDLKPANIKIDPQGRVKVLDFGLAKARFGSGAESVDSNASTADSMAATITSEFTMPGKVIGTAAYMSPEQSRGQEVDKRTDVWAFGCCLYETLTGKRPFKGATTSDLLADILKTDPDFTVIPPETPSEVMTLLRRCLEKEPRRRLRDIGDIAITLEETSSTSQTGIYSAPPATEIVTGNPPVTKLQSVKKLIQVVGSVVLALGFAYAVFDLVVGVNKNSPDRAQASEESIRSIAVLPFVNSTGDPELDGMGDGLAEQISAGLRMTGELERVPRHALVRPFENSEDRDRVIATNLEVESLIQGEITGNADELFVNVILVNGQTEEQDPLVAFPLSNDFRSVASRVVQEVLGRLNLNADAESMSQIGDSGTDNPLAYAAYRQGLEYFDLSSADGRDKAKEEFRLARSLDPDYVEPVVGLGNLRWIAVVNAPTLVPSQKAFVQAREFLEEAKRLDPAHSEVKILEGWIALMGDWKWKDAGEAFRQAIAADPDNGAGYGGLATYLNVVEGRYAEALVAMQRAMELDPQRLSYTEDEAHINRYLENFDKALSRFRQIGTQHPTSWTAPWGAAEILRELDDLKKAEKSAKKAVELSGQDPRALRTLAMIQIASGDRDSAAAILADMKETSSRTYVPAIEIAWIHAALEDWDSATNSLNKAYEERQGGSFIWSMRSPEFMTLCADQPGFWELTDRMGFPGLPLGHPLYQKEREMRYGMGTNSAVTIPLHSTP